MFSKAVFYICLVSTLVLPTVGCDKVEKKPGRKVTGGRKADNPGNEKPDPKAPVVTCDKQWTDYQELQVVGKETTYQESQKSLSAAETTILSQTITKKVIEESDADKVTWIKDVTILAPETGSSRTRSSLLKTKFIELCSKGIPVNLSERPLGIKSTKTEKIQMKFKDVEQDVQHEVYDFSRSKAAVDKDMMELWFGTQAPVQGVLLKMQRTYFRSLPTPSEIRIERELIEVK